MAALNAQAAEPSRIATAFGNTVVTTYPDGRSQHIWLHPDGTWDGISRRGDTLAGRWTLKDQKVCMRQTKPPTLPINYCTAFPADPHVGVTWTSRDVAGTPIRLTVVKGMDEARTPAPRAQ
jgi:phenolic acid decarboxylase